MWFEVVLIHRIGVVSVSLLYELWKLEQGTITASGQVSIHSFFKKLELLIFPSFFKVIRPNQYFSSGFLLSFV